MLKSLKLEKKLLIVNISFFLCALIAILIVFNVFIDKQEYLESKKNLYTISVKIAEQISSLFNSMDTTALQISSNRNIINTFRSFPENKSNFFIDYPFLTQETSNLLNSYNLKKDFFSRICIYNAQNDYIHSGANNINAAMVDSYWDKEDFLKTVEYFHTTENYSLYFPPRTDPYSTATDNYVRNKLFSVIRPLKDFNDPTSSIYGYVEVQQDESAIWQFFKTLPLDTSGYLLDKNGCLLYGTNDKFSDITSKNYQIQYTSINNTISQTVILAKSKWSIYKNTIPFKICLILIIVLLATLIIYIQYFLNNRFTKPLALLRQSVKKVNINNLNLDFNAAPGEDELIQLNKSFNKMFYHLSQSIDELVVVRTSELKAHYLALQAQMDPHFLHNILTIIGIIGEDNNVPEILKITSKLTSMLRFSTSYKEVQCTLGEEAAHTVNYLSLMGERYETMFSYDLYMQEGCENIKIPKLILQPLAENCFKHGFSKKAAPWHIKIRIYLDSGYWYIEISDNGIGFPLKKIEEFYNFIDTISMSHIQDKISSLEIGNLCFENIYLRLKIIYGNNFVYHLTNTKDGGAKIRMGGLIND